MKSQFNYCPFIQMFCSRTSNNMINKIHKRVLRLILNYHTSDFDALLQNNNDTLQNNNLMVEIYKIKNNLNSPIAGFMFEKINTMYNHKNAQELAARRKGTVKIGLEILNCRYP